MHIENSSAWTTGATQVPPVPSPLEGRAVGLCPGDTAHGATLFHCRHMVLLKEQYGKQVVVNLLGSRGGEEVLNRAFKVNALGVWGEGDEGPLPRSKAPHHVWGVFSHQLRILRRFGLLMYEI